MKKQLDGHMQAAHSARNIEVFLFQTTISEVFDGYLYFVPSL